MQIETFQNSDVLHRTLNAHKHTAGPLETVEQDHSPEAEMIEQIRAGKFSDHPEVERWWTSQSDPITASFASLRSNILQATPPKEALTDCGNVVFPDLSHPLHFHEGIGDYQKSRLFEVIAIGLEDYDDLSPHAHKMFERAIAVSAVLLKEKFNEETFLELEAAEVNKIPDAIRNLGRTCIETFEILSPENHLEHHHDHEHEDHNHDAHKETLNKLTWDQRFENIVAIVMSLGQNPNDADLLKQFALLAGKGFVGEVNIDTIIPQELQMSNQKLTELFKTTLKTWRENQHISEDILITILTQLHDPTVTGESIPSLLAKEKLTSQEVVFLLTKEMVLLTRPKTNFTHDENALLAKAESIHQKGIFYVNLTLNHSSAYHMEISPVLNENGVAVIGQNGQPVMQMDLCPHSDQADQTLTQVNEAVIERVHVLHETHTVENLPEAAQDSFTYDDRLVGYPPGYLASKLTEVDTSVPTSAALINIAVNKSVPTNLTFTPMFISGLKFDHVSPRIVRDISSITETFTELHKSGHGQPALDQTSHAHYPTASYSIALDESTPSSRTVPEASELVELSLSHTTTSTSVPTIRSLDLSDVDLPTKLLLPDNISGTDKESNLDSLQQPTAMYRITHTHISKMSSPNEVPQALQRGQEVGAQITVQKHAPEIVIGFSLEKAFKVVENNISASTHKEAVHKKRKSQSQVVSGTRIAAKKTQVTQNEAVQNEEELLEQAAEQGAVQLQQTDAPSATPTSITVKSIHHGKHQTKNGFHLTLALDARHIPLESYAMKQTFEALLLEQSQRMTA